MKALRNVLVIAAAVLAVVGIILAVTSSYTDREDDIDAAIFAAELNNDRAEGAPQQQVVNGWAARDLLEIQARQLNSIEKQQAMNNLTLGLIGAVVALGFLAVVLAPRPSAPTSDVASDTAGEPDPSSPGTQPVPQAWTTPEPIDGDEVESREPSG